MLFESVASTFGARAIAVVLSGSGHDGSEGVQAVHRNGGLTIAQDEASSDYFGMPGSAIHTGDVDFVVSLAGLVSLGKSLDTGESAAGSGLVNPPGPAASSVAVSAGPGTSSPGRSAAPRSCSGSVARRSKACDWKRWQRRAGGRILARALTPRAF